MHLAAPHAHDHRRARDFLVHPWHIYRIISFAELHACYVIDVRDWNWALQNIADMTCRLNDDLIRDERRTEYHTSLEQRRHYAIARADRH